MKSIFLNDKIMLIIIVLNTIVIFIGGYYQNVPAIDILDTIFTFVFCVEAYIKITHFGWKNYWDDGWNKFDFVLVILALPSVADLFMEASLSTNVFLAFRSLRILKAFRLFRFIPHINQLLDGLKLAIKSSLFVSAAFTVFLLLFSILTSALFGKYAPDYFGNPALSIYSIFRLFTIEGWYEMPEAIATGGGDIMGIFAKIYFSVLLFAGGIIGLSLINSIFVDAMATDNNDKVMEKLTEIEKEISNIKNNQNN